MITCHPVSNRVFQNDGKFRCGISPDTFTANAAWILPSRCSLLVLVFLVWPLRLLRCPSRLPASHWPMAEHCFLFPTFPWQWNWKKQSKRTSGFSFTLSSSPLLLLASLVINLNVSSPIGEPGHRRVFLIAWLTVNEHLRTHSSFSPRPWDRKLMWKWFSDDPLTLAVIQRNTSWHQRRVFPSGTIWRFTYFQCDE